MPKPKDELMDLSKICSATHAKGTILEIETEIKFHRDGRGDRRSFLVY